MGCLCALVKVKQDLQDFISHGKTVQYHVCTRWTREKKSIEWGDIILNFHFTQLSNLNFKAQTTILYTRKTVATAKFLGKLMTALPVTMSKSRLGELCTFYSL